MAFYGSRIAPHSIRIRFGSVPASSCDNERDIRTSCRQDGGFLPACTRKNAACTPTKSKIHNLHKNEYDKRLIKHGIRKEIKR